jgi:hypothetical protein
MTDAMTSALGDSAMINCQYERDETRDSMITTRNLEKSFSKCIYRSIYLNLCSAVGYGPVLKVY